MAVIDSTESATWAIVKAVAEEKEVEPGELEIVIEQHVDTGAIERLVANNDTSWTFSFDLPETIVTVTDEDVVYVQERGHQLAEETTR
jgi:hypothetical protein